MLNLPLCHWSSQLFDLRAPSSTEVQRSDVQPIIYERGGGGRNHGGGGGGVRFISLYDMWVESFFGHKETHKGRKIIIILNLLQWTFGFPFFNKVSTQNDLCVRILIINIKQQHQKQK